MDILVVEAYKGSLKDYITILKQKGKIHLMNSYNDSFINSFYEYGQFFKVCLIESINDDNSGINLLRSIRTNEDKFNLNPCDVIIITPDESTCKVLNFFAFANDIFLSKISIDNFKNTLSDIGML